MFQVPFWDPRVFFGRISLPSDQEGVGGWGSAVANDLFDFIFLFSIDKVRGWRWEVLAVDFIFRNREIRGKHGRLGGSSRSLVGRVDKR